MPKIKVTKQPDGTDAYWVPQDQTNQVKDGKLGAARIPPGETTIYRKVKETPQTPTSPEKK